MVTGEPMPVEKRAGDAVIGGTVNTTGSFLMTADEGRRGDGAGADRRAGRGGAAQPRAGAETRRPGRRLVRAGRGARRGPHVRRLVRSSAPSRAGATRSSTPSRCSSSPARARSGWPRRCRSWSASAAGSAGVLIRNGRRAGAAWRRSIRVVVDKTGTLTEGKPRLVAVVPATGCRRAELLALAAGLEQGSEHPLAAAIVAGREGARRRLCPRPRSSSRYRARAYAAASTGRRGGARQPRDDGCRTVRGLRLLATRPRNCARDGQTVVFVAIDGKRRACSASPTRSRQSTPEAVQAAARRRAFASSCSPATAAPPPRRWRRQLGIDEVHAEVLPEQKVEVVRRAPGRGPRRGDGRRRHQRRPGARRGRRGHRDGHRHRRGDGERPASRSCKGDLRGIARARHLSRATMRNIRQNLVLRLRLQRRSASPSRPACSIRSSACC